MFVLSEDNGQNKSLYFLNYDMKNGEENVNDQFQSIIQSIN